MNERIFLHRFRSRQLMLLLACWCFASNVYSQTSRQVTGKVTDDRNEGLPGVNIQIKGTATGTSTQADGSFSLAASESASLIFSFIGYKSQEVPVGNNSRINITLLADISTLEEIVVVGYGTQSRETVTSSITKLDTKVLENVPYANAASALQGALSGVQVQSTSGQPGAAPRVIVRGGTSINNPNGAAPLYIIDGIIRTNMNDISSDDIESLNVLKDAASTAIYGARASNGVVIITTKTGKSGKTKVSYSYDLTSSRVGKTYDLANAREYIYFNRIGTQDIANIMNPSAASRLSLPIGYGTGNNLTNNTAYTTQYLTAENGHKLNEGWESMPDPLDSSKTIIYQDTDWQDEIFRTAISHNHHLSLSGGTEKATFNAGLGYMTNQGTAITTKYDRLTFNLNGQLQVKDNLRFFGRAMFSNSGNNEVYNLTNIFYRSAGTPPSAKFRFEDGTLAPGQSRSIGNPVYHLNNDKRDNNTENLTLAAGGHWEILPGLSFDPQISLYRTSYDGYSFIPAYWNGPTTYNISRVATSSYIKMLQQQADAVFSYSKTIGLHHNLDIKAGFSYFGRKNSTLDATGQGAATDLIPTLNASSQLVSMSSTISDQTILGYFSRINYDYKQKYMLSVNARYDGASNLGETHKWGFFPGVSVGWNLHNEEFWKALPANLLHLKLRGSYGVNGNISGLSDFQSQGEYGVGARYSGNSAIQNTVIPNASLKWEQSKTFDIGADIGLYSNRINILFDYYRRVTENLITSLTLPPSTGFSSIFTNLGSLQNKGLEIEVSAQILPSGSPLQWNLSLAAAKTRHKILTLPFNGIENNRVGGVNIWDAASNSYRWMGGLQEGGTIGNFYGYNQIKIYSTDEEAMAGPVNTLVPALAALRRGGDVRWEDADGNNQIDSRDMRYLGNPYPVWNGGISNTLSYKGINLLVRMDYTTGHYIYNYPKVFMDGNWQGDGNMTRDMVENSWKKQGDITSLPRFTWQQNGWNNPGPSSRSVEKGDFLCLREVTLSYVLPATIAQKVRLSNVRFNLTGSNLHYFTQYQGINPEEGGQDNGRYPVPKNITFGVSVSL